MHIADGILPLSVSLSGYALTAAGLAFSLRRLDARTMPQLAVVTSGFFVASLIHLPLGPTSVHLLLPGLVGALLGRSAFLSIVIGLFLQSMLFQFGGLTALGANSLMMGLPALLCGWLFQRFQGHTRTSRTVAGTLVGALGVLMAAIFLAFFLMLSGEAFHTVAKLALAAHVPVMVIEGLVTGSAIAFLHRVKPELLNNPFTKPETKAP
ncbi:MAG: cobalt transporter CbiM [Desulfobulbus sp.]|jgi:cobalt/nickel transport system permease protein